jgi:uncharacterized protein (DUF2267 family)
MKIKSLCKATIALLVLTTMFSGCAAIGSMFKGSAKKYDSGMEDWNNENYTESISQMITIIMDDDGYKPAKEFVNMNFQVAIDKSLDKINFIKLQGSNPIQDSLEVFNLYKNLNSIVRKAKRIVPLEGPKGAWIWNPDLSNDFVSELDEARQTAVDLRLNEITELFNNQKFEDALNMVNDTKKIFIDTIEIKTDASTKTKDEFLNQVPILMKETVSKMLVSSNQEVLKQCRDILDVATEYSEKDDAEIASLQKKIENRLCELIINEGKIIEEKGDLESLLAAKEIYYKGYKEYPDNEIILKAHNDVCSKISNIYYNEGYALEKKGDIESLEEALVQYVKGSKYASENEKYRFEEASIRTNTAIADVYYQQGLLLEPEVGIDIEKGAKVIELYQKAQEWVENYKDTETRIANIQKAITVKIFVLANINDSLNTNIEKAMATSLKNILGEGYNINSATLEDYGFTSSMANSTKWESAAKTNNANYIVFLNGKVGKIYDEIETDQYSESIHYRIDKKGDISKITAAEYILIETRKEQVEDNSDFFDRSAFLESLDLIDYGKETVTSTDTTRKLYIPITIDYKVVNAETGRTIYTGTKTTQHLYSKEKINSQVSAKSSIISSWYRDNYVNIRTEFSPDPTTEQIYEFCNKKAKIISNYDEISESILEDRF